jgi:hypothetical protein
MEKFSEEIQYSPVVSNHSTVIYRNVAPQSSTSVTLSATSSVGPTEVIIPPSVWNPSKSRLNFNLRIPEVDTKYTWTNANMLTLISRLVFYDSSTNAVLLDCGNFDKYASLVVPAGTHIDSHLTKAFVSGAPAATEALANPRPVEDISKSNLANNYTGQTTGDIGAYAPYTGRRQFYISPVGNGAAAGDAFFNVSIPFEAFKLTFLSINKMVYFPSNVVLQVYWNAGNQFCFTANSAADTTTNQTCAVAPIISNVSIQLANEANLALVSQIIDKVMREGLTMPIAYPTTTRQSLSASTAHSYSLQLTKGYGNRILALISAPFSAANTTTVASQLHARGTLSVYNTLINNVALLYPAGLDATKGQDYTVGNKQYLSKSAVQAIGEYLTCEWVHVDSFAGQKPLWKIDEEQTEIDGLDVGMQSSTWSLQATLTASTAYIWITSIIGQKQLTITNQGSMVM